MKVLFSSWQNKIVDNRERSEDAWEDSPNVKLPDTFDGERKFSGFIGWGGMILLDKGADAVEMTYQYAKSLQASSCAKCFPCRAGTKVMEDALERIVDGKGSESDFTQLEGLCDDISKNSKCGIGQLGPKPIVDAVTHFKEDFMDYIAGRKKRPGHRYPYKMTAPCTSACPTGMDIPAYIEFIKDSDFKGSLENIREASPLASTLGRACFHPCENNCRRANVDTSIAICKLKRSAWDWEDQHEVEKPSNPNRHKREEKIAVIGGGPAGASCAYYLALEGYRVTVYEKLLSWGGASWTGIPQYRIPKEILSREYRYLEDIGIEFKFGVEFGKDETFKSLRKKGYKAFFLATGGDLSKDARVKGEHDGHEGFYGGISILKDVVMNTMPNPPVKPPALPTPETVLVIGGGNTAFDCVRTFIRLGSKDVNIVYRRTKNELPADPHEVHEAEAEGVKFQFLLAPTKIVAKKGKVVGLECQKMQLGEPDSSGRRSPVAVEGSEHVIKADMIIAAIGQDCDIKYLDEEPTIKKSKWDTIVTNEDTYQTEVPDVFAGGDVQTGPLTLVTAVGQARRAAQSIGQYLRGEPIRISDEQAMEKVIAKIGAYDKKEIIPMPGGWSRQEMPICGADDKLKTFTEVELGYTTEQAMEEAARCMRCYIVGMVSIAGDGK
ncbi:MAG: FAD-dependent oxidoreductase [Nitrospinota bacterium]|nr:FAD-dependent oxidoreductase [Nitrospinota bacterium]